MCERARLMIYGAFRNIKDRQQLQPVAVANTTFACKFVQKLRLDPRFRGINVNAHWVEEASARVIDQFSLLIKQGSFDRTAFETTLAEEILRTQMPMHSSSIPLANVLDLVKAAQIDGTRNLGQWLNDWSKAEGTQFITLTDQQQQERGKAATDPALDEELAAQRAAIGITDKDLCG
ncbi:MAG: hypothetical protein ABIE84_01750 [bacterium]